MTVDTQLASALGRQAEAGAAAIEWAVAPGGSGERLVPLDSRRAAAASISPRGDSGRVTALARRALAAGLRAGVAQPLLRRRVRVARPGSLVAAIEEALGTGPLSVGVDAGRPRTNRKPVLQVIDRDGTTVAWAKVGWNDLTRGLVAHEADVLERLSRSTPAGITVPGVIARLSVGDLDVVLTRPLETRRRVAGSTVAPAAVVRVGADVAPAATGPLLDSAWWGDRRDRVDAEAAAAVSNVLDGVSGVTCGWHGDLSPWNWWRAGGRICVVDWERATGPVPLGIDVLHGPFLVGVLRDRRDAASALRVAAVAARPVLAELGITAGEEVRAVAAAYATELLVRFGDDERKGGRGPVAARELQGVLIGMADPRVGWTNWPDDELARR
jgi:hypothetical protein